MDDALKCILDVYDVAQCLISIWIIPRRQQHAAVCRIKLHTWRQTGYSVILMSLLLLRTTTANNFTFEYFLLGFRHSLMQCNNNKIKQRSYCPTFMLSSSAIYSPVRSIISKPIQLQFWAYCCNWIESLLLNSLTDVPIEKWQQQLLLLPCNIFRVNPLVCATWPYRRRRRMNCLEFGRGSIQSCQNAEWNKIKTCCLLPIFWWFFLFFSFVTVVECAQELVELQIIISNW
jgi:hypothetical protein